jgi:hypothetical protein
MKNYRKEITKRAERANSALRGYKVIDLRDGDKVLGTIAVEGTVRDVYEVKTPNGLKELDLSKYEHAIDSDLKIIELSQRYDD